MKRTRFRLMVILAFVSFYLSVSACSTIAQWAAPEKVATKSDPEKLAALEREFWETFHGGQFQNISKLLNQYKALYVEQPNHPKIAARIGFLHIWRLSERRRLKEIGPEITDDATLCEKFFHEAYHLQSDDARYMGFWSSCILAQAEIHQNERDIRKGYFLMKDSIDAWPEFNYFTAGYVMSGQDWDGDIFQEALAWQWKNLDACADEKLDRNQPDYRPYMAKTTNQGSKRACWNSTIAPHNFEGFFLNMGDMLVKNGQVDVARKIYNTAKLSPDFKSWPFQKVLEDRIKNADQNVALFRKKLKNNENPDHPKLMFWSEFSCMACHQKK